MNKICGYSCEHNKGGVCQITICDKILKFSTTTNNYSEMLFNRDERLIQELQRKDNIIKDAKEVLLTTNNIEKALNVLDKIKELEDK